MAVIGWYPMLQQENVDLSSIQWELHEEYPVKYWKRLAGVHLVTFRSRSNSESARGPVGPWR